MKKQHLLLLLALAAFSCAREGFDPDSFGPDNYLRGTICDDEAVTRTILVDNPGVKLETRWQDDDRIAVFGGSARNAPFSIIEGSVSVDGKTANFTSALSDIPTGMIVSYTPYQEGASVDGNDLLLTFPAVQRYLARGGVSRPDPDASLLVAYGNKSGGLKFRTTLAVLKIGQVFDRDVTLSRLEFRDLDGKPVSGQVRITPGDASAAQFVGDGKVLTLDCGDGVDVYARSLSSYFLVVPARSYPKGFELTFVLKDGTTVVKTVGTKMGKTLERGVVYQIGDITTETGVPGAATRLDSRAVIVTPQKMDLVQVLERRVDFVRDENGRACYDLHDEPIMRPWFDLLVHKDFLPESYDWLIFDTPTDDLPEGGVYKVVSREKLDDTYYDVHIEPEMNVFAPFKEAVAGSPLFDEGGNFLEDGGFDIDLASYVRSIVDEDGNELPFTVGSDGELCFEGKETAELLGVDTRAMFNHTFTVPGLDLNLKTRDDDAITKLEANISSKMTLDMKAAVKVFDGELQLLHVTVQPALVLDGKYSIRGEVSKSVRKHLFTVYTTPIPIAPGLLLCPEIEFEGGISVGASLKFTTNLKFVHSFGMYGFSYNNGDGFTFRHRVTPPGEDEGFSPSVDGFEGYLYASANLYVTPSVSLYGLIGAGVETNLGLTFSLTSNGEGSKLALSPSIEFMPKVASLGGLLSHTFKELTASIPLDPIWERWFTPNWTRRGLTFQYVMTEDYYMIPGCYYFPLPCGLKADYDFVLKNATLFDYDVAIDVYEAITPIPWNLLGPSYATFGTGDGEKTVYFSDFLEGGYEHLWPFLVGHYLTYRNAEWKFVDRILVGKFKKGCEEEQKFSGEVPYSFQSGKLYRLAGRLPGYYDTSAAFGDTAIEQDLATLPLFYWPTTGTGALYEPLSNGH